MTSSKTSKLSAETKIGSVTVLLRRKNGASLVELGKTTGWQPHTVRAALTGLRKKGYNIERKKRDDVTIYAIVSKAKG